MGHRELRSYQFEIEVVEMKKDFVALEIKLVSDLLVYEKLTHKYKSEGNFELMTEYAGKCWTLAYELAPFYSGSSLVNQWYVMAVHNAAHKYIADGGLCHNDTLTVAKFDKYMEVEQWEQTKSRIK